jgi:mannose-6-phosphate isomerase-like protein (cupin superfamily)
LFEVQVVGARVADKAAHVLGRVPLSPFEAERIIVPVGTPFKFGEVFNLAEVVVPPGVTTSQHNLGVNERYLVLEGRGSMFLDDAVQPVDAGSVVHIPSGVMQAIRNDSAGDVLRFYCLCTPPFSQDTYGRGAWNGSGPAGFDLSAWWARHGADLA